MNCPLEGGDVILAGEGDIPCISAKLVRRPASGGSSSIALGARLRGGMLEYLAVLIVQFLEHVVVDHKRVNMGENVTLPVAVPNASWR